MAERMTMEEAQRQTLEAIEHNRSLGVQEYKNGERQSDEVWEVTEGYKHLPMQGEKRTLRLGPGHRFHPTVDQVEKTRRGKGGLLNKARPLTATEMDGLRSARRPMVAGADLGIRAMEFTSEGTAEYALSCGLKEEDFDGVKPAYGGKYTRAQVDEILIAKQAASN